MIVQCRAKGRPGTLAGGRDAFTLIELLMVAALIVIMVGGLAVGLRRNSAAALRNAEQLVAGLIGQAQFLAISTQSATRLAIAPDEAQAFRVLQTFRLGSDGTWETAGPIIYLPRGVAVVPPLEGESTGTVAPVDHSQPGRAPGGEFSGELGRASRVWLLQFEPNGELGERRFEGARIVIAHAGPSLGVRAAANADQRILRISPRGSVATTR